MTPILRRTAATAALFVATAGLAACDSLFGPSTGAPGQLEQLPRALTAHETQVIHGSNRFAFDILRETLRDQPADNILLSPLSAFMALGMTVNGARGDTQSDMARVLGFEHLPVDRMNEAYRSLIALLLSLDPAVDMRLANSVWSRHEFPVRPEFHQTVRDFFGAEAASLDFASPQAAATINDWVTQKTGGRIRELVPDPIPPDVLMYLINAVFFKGDWRYSFDQAQTRDMEFTRGDGSRTTVRMMNRSGRVPLAYDPVMGAQVVELTYGRGAFAMTLVLPSSGTDLDVLIEGLDDVRWQSWVGQLAETHVQLGLPRFRLEYETNMNEPLITLGMGRAFGRLPGTDFSGLSPDHDGLFISNVVQKTFIDVNEAGTEAAAATMVEISRVSGPPSITFDRPFLLAIRERFSGTILFLGRIGDPVSP
jgi:serine protease inhibitor